MGFGDIIADPSVLLSATLILVVAGALIGVLAGLFGVGGGAISVPVFFETFLRQGLDPDTAMPLAVGTSLAMIVPTSILSARSHAAKGALDRDLLRRWALPVLVGVLAGTVIARFAPAELFQVVFIAVATTMSIKLLAARRPWQLRDHMPDGFATGLYGAIVGLVSTLMGIGGGAISNLVLTLHGFQMHRAVATSAGVGVLVSVPGTVGYVLAGWAQPGLPPGTLGYVSLTALVLTLPTALLTTRLGVTLAHALSREVLSRLFGVFLLLVAARFLAAIL